MILIIFLAAVTLITSAIAISGKAPQLRLSITKGGEVCDGVLPGVDESSHISEVPEGEIRYLINKKVSFETPYSLGNVMLENPQSCEYDLRFFIFDSNGLLIYESPELKPGQYIEKDKLTTVVAAGEYNCAYSARAYQQGELMGEVTGLLTVTIG